MVVLKLLFIFVSFSRSRDSSEPDTERESLRNTLRLKLPLVSDISDSSEKSPSSVKDVILASSKSILGKVLSPTKEKYTNRDKVNIVYALGLNEK